MSISVFHVSVECIHGKQVSNNKVGNTSYRSREGRGTETQNVLDLSKASKQKKETSEIRTNLTSSNLSLSEARF